MTPIVYLIIFTSIGMLSDKDSMALVAIPTANQVECVTAGNIAVNKFGGGTKRVEFVCVQGVK